MTLAMMAAPVGSASSRHNESGASTTAMPSVSSATVWTTILRTAPAAELGELRSVLGTQLVAEIEDLDAESQMLLQIVEDGDRGGSRPATADSIPVAHRRHSLHLAAATLPAGQQQTLLVEQIRQFVGYLKKRDGRSSSSGELVDGGDAATDLHLDPREWAAVTAVMKEGGATVMNVSGAAAVAKQSSAPRKSSALQKQVPNATAQKMARIKNDQYIWTMNDLVHELRSSLVDERDRLRAVVGELRDELESQLRRDAPTQAEAPAVLSVAELKAISKKLERALMATSSTSPSSQSAANRRASTSRLPALTGRRPTTAAPRLTPLGSASARVGGSAVQLPPRCKSVTPQASVTSRRYSAVPMPPKAPQSTVSSTNVRRATMAPRQGSSSSVSLASATSRRTSMTSGKSTPTVARKVTPSRQDSLPEFDLGLDNISLSGANADSASAPSLFDISALITHVQADIMDKSMDADEAVPPSASSSSTSSSSVRSRLYAKRAQQEHEAKARVTEMAAYAGMRATPSRMSSSSLRESLSVESLVGVIRAEPAPVAAAPHQLTNPDIAQDRTVEMEEEIAREVDKLSASFDALVAASPTKRIPRGFGM